MQLPREIADRVRLNDLVRAALAGDARGTIGPGEVHSVRRKDGIEFSFAELRHMDPEEKRPAVSRLAIARENGVYCLITFDFWVGDESKAEPVWEEMLRSLMLGLTIADPTVGPVVN